MGLKAYRPSGSVPVTAQLILAFLVLLGGVVVGGLLFLVSKLIYLVLFFPVGTGVVAAYAVKSGVRTSKVRSPLVAGFYGLLLGLIIYGSYHYFDYLQFRAQARSDIARMVREEDVSLEPSQVELMIDGFLFDETGRPGFPGFLLLKASDGVSIGNVLGDDFYDLGTFFTWVYWLAELGIIAGLAAYYGWEAGGYPYCESCDRWYGAGAHLGSIEGSAKQDLLHLVEAGDFQQMGEMLEERVPPPSVRVYLESCEVCESSDSKLILEEASISRTGRGESKTILQGMISPRQRAALLRGAADEAAESAAEASDPQAS